MEGTMKARMACLGLAAGLLLGPAHAEDVIKIAFIDPLSGPAAAVGGDALKEFGYLADEINAAGGLNGKKVEIISLDNKGSPQESLIQVQKAADAGVRIITQGNSSTVAATLSDWVTKYNDRNPGKEIIYFDYAANDHALTNDKCSYWHFRWDANSDIKMAALTNFMKTRLNLKKVSLINQDYSYGRSVHTQARAMLKEKRPDIEIVGDELHPLLKITDFAPYVAKIKGSGADSVITGNWGPDIDLLLRAAADAGLQTDWYTYFGATPPPSSKGASRTACLQSSPM
jgi:branched-chain amino acid transport system substrate-binding protein